MTSKLLFVLLISLSILLAGCNTPQQQDPITVRVIADGRGRTYLNYDPVTVEQFLRDAEITLDPLDRMNPEPWTQIFDGITITIVRVVEEEVCEDVSVPYRQERVPVEGLSPEEERVGQAGRNGVQRICYRERIEDGVPRDRVEISRIETIAPQNEIIYIGPVTELEPVSFSGTLAYINNANAWVMRGGNTTKRLLTTTGDLDERVFSLSSDGKQLLFARQNEDETTFGNQLWFISDITLPDSEPIALMPRDVLYAEWVPDAGYTISYSTAEPRPSPPGWTASNDLLIMRINPQTGEHINVTEVLGRSGGGLHGWWGMQFTWSPDGTKLAWIRADAVGLVDLENGELGAPLLEYAFLRTLSDWSWRTTVSWSMDSSLIIATVHGPPYGSEPPETSTIFNIAAADVGGTFQATLGERTGIWAAPSYSPHVNAPDNPFPRGYLAYLRARKWDESIRGEYDLVVADRDGSNARIVFPPSGQPGIGGQVGGLAWSPDGRQLALIYLHNLWIVNVETGVAHQLTQDGGASKPVWMP